MGSLSALGSNLMQRVEPLPTGTERELLIDFLDFQRATVLHKASGLTKNNWPSATSLRA